MAWKCPECEEINNNDSMIRCPCGYEASENDFVKIENEELNNYVLNRKTAMKEKASIGRKILGYILGAIGFFIMFGVFLEISPVLFGFKKAGGDFFVAMTFALLSIWLIWESSKVAQSLGTITAWSAVFSLSYFGMYMAMKNISAEKVGSEAQYYAGMANLAMGVGVALVLLIITISVVAFRTARKRTASE